ncbi:MAG: hypothetical protein FD166_1283 [Bacteroidetes bacterium]|jgi:hypothetical protein|nr:MAG: hypothetical protein FD166_1283 [Bacteroidota bacterium]
MKLKVVFLFCLFVLTGCFRVFAQDIQGSSDHPLFSRIPGFSINDYMVEEPGIYSFHADQDSIITVEGKKTTIHYMCNCVESPLRIIRSFSNSVRPNGGRSIEYSDNRIYINLKKNGREYWAEVYAGQDDYFLTIIELNPVIENNSGTIKQQ